MTPKITNENAVNEKIGIRFGDSTEEQRVTPPINGQPGSTSTHDHTVEAHHNNAGPTFRKISLNEMMENAEIDDNIENTKVAKTLLELAVE